MIFVDEARILVKAGDGGKGCESFYRDRRMRYPRPDGGDGGYGGDVIITADKSIHTLLDFKYKQHYQADKGGNASSKNKSGRRGKECRLRVPVGTIVRDHSNGLLMKDLNADQQSVVVVQGAPGGLGNARRRTPAPPGKGQERVLDFELKLIADVGLIGFPNAGKSTLITAISKAKSKIANYPFTTKQPILGIVEGEDYQFVVADLPGLIEGAHKGKGLGDRFLRHAERTKIFLHVLDMAATEGRDPLEDYEKIEHELTEYSDNFVYKRKIVVANKMDLPAASDHLKRFKRKYKKEEIVPVSSLEKQGLETLVDLMRDTLCKENSQDR